MRKLLRFRYILLLLLVLSLGITLIVFYGGGLSVGATQSTLMEFSKEGFFLPEEEDLDPHKLVASNVKYDMYLDESTTIITIVDKVNNTVYRTGDDRNENSRLMTPFFIEYYDTSSVSGSIARMNAYDNSILYHDELTDKQERHYALKYGDDSVQILYEIGRFGVTLDWFPIRITEERYRQMFAGYRNTERGREAEKAFKNGEITEEEYEDLAYVNPFITSLQRSRWSNNYQPEKFTDKVTGEEITYYTLEYTPLRSLLKSYLYEALYVVNEDGYGGYQAFDENNMPMWETDSDGEYVRDEDGKRIPIREIYTRDHAALDNAATDYVDSETGMAITTTSPHFEIGIEFKLTHNGLEATLIKNSIKEGPDFDTTFVLTSIEFLPNITQVSDVDTQDGYMVIPDGSGALVRFNNGKTNYRAYNKGIYGSDKSLFPGVRPEGQENLMFPMYGFIDKSNNRGILAIVDKGASMNRISADIPRRDGAQNRIYFKTSFRSNESVTVGQGYNARSFTKWSRNIPNVDFTYRYDFLDKENLHYTGLAHKYRNYLIEKYGLEEKTTNFNNGVDINLLGAFEEYDLFLGFKYKKTSTLTTFKQAEEIIKTLQNLGVSNMDVSYTSWTNDGFEQQVRRNTKVAKVLGGKKGLQNLSEFLADNNIDFYPVTNVATTTGYNLSFGKMKYTSRSISSSYAEHANYNLSTLLPDRSSGSTIYLSPNYYQANADMLLRSFNKLGVKNLSVLDVGNFRIANYSRSTNISLHEGQLFQENLLKQLSDEMGKLQLKAPYDYAFPYTKSAVDVPTTSSRHGLFDESIPFYQLVVSGLFDYSTRSVNKDDRDDNSQIMRFINTGSRLKYELTYENPGILLETKYHNYYYTFYENWIDKIAQMNNDINELNIRDGRLLSHHLLADYPGLIKVTYSNGTEIILNESMNSVNYKGITIASNSYKKIKG